MKRPEIKCSEWHSNPAPSQQEVTQPAHRTEALVPPRAQARQWLSTRLWLASFSLLGAPGARLVLTADAGF